jgi:hypothetical protein
MTFREAVRETFKPRLMGKRTTVLTALTSVLLSMGIARQTDPVLLYAFFLSLLGFTIFLYPFPERVVGHPAWQAERAILPVLTMLGLSLFVFAIVLVVDSFPWAVAGQDVLYLLILLGVIAPSVEEFARWTWLHTLPYSPLTANLFWVMLHPAVARVFTGQGPDLAFALFAFLFGLAMTWVMWAVEGKHGKYFGPVAAITIHGAYNSLVVLWTVSIGGTPLVAF